MDQAKPLVLVIDDMALSRRRIISCLKELGYSEIREATDGDEGWKLLESAEKPFGLVVSDWNMPNLSGLELLIRIRGDERFKSLPFVLVTAEADAVKKADAFKGGVSGIINKPFDSEIFSRKMKEILGS